MSEKTLTGYPSIDKPWMKYYSKEYIVANLPHESAISYAYKRNRERLNLLAIDSSEGNYSYQETFEVIQKTATALQSIGVGKGDIILIMLPATAYEIFLFYATDLVGGALSFLPPGTTKESVCNSIRDFSSDHLFIYGTFLSEAMERTVYQSTNIKSIITIGKIQDFKHDIRTLSWEDFIARGRNRQLKEVSRAPEDMLFIAKTGGTTGEPKNVMLNDNGFNILVDQYLHTELPYNSGDRWLRLWPIFSATAAVSSLHLAMCAGMESIIRDFPLSISDFDKMVLEEKPNHLILIPQLLDVLEKSALLAGKNLDFIKSVGCGGLSITSGFEERVNRWFKRFDLSLFLGYGWGCTESSSGAVMRMNKETSRIGCI